MVVGREPRYYDRVMLTAVVIVSALSLLVATEAAD
jgi:hypothetical protein